MIVAVLGGDAEPLGTCDVFGDVERALLVQVVPGSPWPAALRGRAMCSSDRARTRASSTSATASRSPFGSRATTILRPSSPTRGPRPESAGSCATSSRWAPGRSRSWTRSSWARSTTPGAVGSSTASCAASPATATRSACRPSAASSRFDPGYRDNPLVNVLCLGVLPDRASRARPASGEGNLAVLLGSLTGRDGIGGVSVLASAGLGR